MKFEDRQAINMLAQALYERSEGDNESFEASVKMMLKDLGLTHMIHPDYLRRR